MANDGKWFPESSSVERWASVWVVDGETGMTLGSIRRRIAERAASEAGDGPHERAPDTVRMPRAKFGRS